MGKRRQNKASRKDILVVSVGLVTIPDAQDRLRRAHAFILNAVTRGEKKKPDGGATLDKADPEEASSG